MKRPTGVRVADADPDARATRRASIAIGWQIMAASAVLVLGIVVVTTVFLLHQALPREQIDLRDSHAHVYIDSSDVLQALLLVGAGAVVFAGAVSWIVARRAVAPLGTALRLQRQFVADASHELRTPLAVLDARLQVLERRLDNPATSDPASTRSTVGELRHDSKALIDIVNDLLLAAGGDEQRRTTLDPAPVITEAVASLEILARERDVALDVGAQEPVLVSIPATSLRRCVVAPSTIRARPFAPRRYPRTSRAPARVSRSSSYASPTRAPASPGSRRKRAFERFAHASPSGRERAQPDAEAPRPSFGIGLALVRDIAERQGGRVRVESTGPTGTTMTLDILVAR